MHCGNSRCCSLGFDLYFSDCDSTASCELSYEKCVQVKYNNKLANLCTRLTETTKHKSNFNGKSNLRIKVLRCLVCRKEYCMFNMSEVVNSKRRKMDNKNYYKNQNKAKYLMEPGQIGFLATCNFREKDCVREAYNLLNEYADQKPVQENSETAIASEKSQTKDTPENSGTVVGAKVHDDDDGEEEEDIATTLEKQINTITKAKKFDCSRFQQIDSKIPNCIFIKTTIKDPNELGVRLVRDIAATKTQKTRYLLRLWPVDTVCRANNQDILNAAGRLFDKFLLNREPSTYAVVVNKRHNTTFDRMKIIQEIAKLIDFKCPAHKVDLKNPKITIAIEIMKGLCCISVLPDYFLLKKYNVYELAQPEKSAEEKTTGEKSAQEKPVEEKPAEENPNEDESTKGSLVEEKQTEYSVAGENSFEE